mgnify:CR=1 FL=1
MKNKILSIISLITIFIPITMLFVWKPTSPSATVIAIGYCIFIAVSFCYALFLFTNDAPAEYLHKNRSGCQCSLFDW